MSEFRPLSLAAPSIVVAIVVLASAAGAGTALDPEVVDDNTGEVSLPAELDVRDGWVTGETRDTFSVVMRLASISGLPEASVVYHYHFHFQVDRTDGATSLYHAMVHRTGSGGWSYMVERWISTGPTGRWGDTNFTSGSVDIEGSTISVVVRKAFVVSPLVDFQRSTWTIDRFYIHADSVNASTGEMIVSDAAPSAGTMGSYAVSQGVPAAAGSGAPGPVALAVVVALAGAGLVWRRRRLAAHER